VSARLERRGPAAGEAVLALDAAPHRAGAMDEQVAQVRVAAFADAEQSLAPTGGVLARNQAKPGGQTAAVLQQLRILADGGQQRGGALGPKAGDGHQGSCLDIALGDLVIVVGDPLIEVTQLIGQRVQIGVKAFAQSVIGVLQDRRQAPLDRRTSWRDLNAVFQQQAADLVDLRGAPLHRQPAQAVDGLDILLLRAS